MVATTRLETKRTKNAHNAALRNAAWRVFKTRKNATRHAAARIIQRAWKGALLDVPGKPPIHRSRVVRHRGIRYNARNHYNAATMHNSNRFEGRLMEKWPTGIHMTNENAARIRARGENRETPYERRFQRDVDRMRAALAAYHEGPSAFRPYRDNGWSIMRVKLLQDDRTVSFSARASKFLKLIKIVDVPIKKTWYPSLINWYMQGLYGITTKRFDASKAFRTATARV